MWFYSQSTGRLTHYGELIGTGYAGHPPYVNDPLAQDKHGCGPLPQGMYTIGQEVSSTLGPITMPLQPYPQNEMYGRSGFYMHGDNPAHVGWSSDGCIIMPHDVRNQVSVSTDRVLMVTW